MELSAICYGTMRLVPSRFEESEIETLLLEAFDRGITSVHVSQEYESYRGVCRALSRARAARPASSLEVIAKIAVPHFDEAEIAPGRLRSLVETTLRDVHAERIDLVQWLVRHTPNDDAPRIALLDRGADTFRGEWEALRAEGKVGALGVFPYSMPFLERTLDLPFVDGVVSYYNERERELEPFFAALHERHLGAVGIRPLCAGTIRDEAAVANAIAFALHPPIIASTIVGLSTLTQIQAATTATQ